jgi:hypothetical protein
MVKSEFPPVSDVSIYGEIPTSSGRINDVGYTLRRACGGSDRSGLIFGQALVAGAER